MGDGKADAVVFLLPSQVRPIGSRQITNARIVAGV
jgi:hypothetical protein